MHVAWASFSSSSFAAALVATIATIAIIAAFVTTARSARSFAAVPPRRQQASRPLTTAIANDKTNEACHVA
jgi:hypothetical protein